MKRYFLYKLQRDLFSHSPCENSVHPCEVLALRRLCALPKVWQDIDHDSWALKKLFTYGCRKSGADKALTSSPHRRVSCINQGCVLYGVIVLWLRVPA